MTLMAVNAPAGPESMPENAPAEAQEAAQGQAEAREAAQDQAEAREAAQGQAGAAHGTLKVLSFNVRQWTRDVDAGSATFWRTRMEAMRRMIDDVDPDVICLQEFMAPVGRYIPDGYRRVGATVSHPIFVRKGLETSRHAASIFWETCMVGDVQVINVHSRWESEVVTRTVAAVNARVADGTQAEPSGRRAPAARTVACGDFNCSLAMLRKHGLTMASAREVLGVPEVDTFANFTKASSHGAIDHFFVSGVMPVTYRMVTEPYGAAPEGASGTFKMSDHFPICLEIAW